MWTATKFVVRPGCVRAAAVVMVFAAVKASAGLLAPGDATAKTPGKTYCFNGVCHRVLTLAQTRARLGRAHSVIASFYNDCRVDRFNPCGLTSSGAVFEAHKADNAASPIYPNGTKLLVFNPSNGRAAVLRVNNAGPYKGGRTLDVSRAAADKLGFRSRGVARLMVKVIHAPSAAEARYRARRRYAPVKGYMGRFASLSAAAAAARGGRASGTRVAIALPEARPEPVARPEPARQPAAVAVAAAAGVSGSGGPAGAKEAVELPGRLARPLAPLPVQPASDFAREIATLAAANRATERRRQIALVEQQQRERERQIALAKQKAEQAAEAARQAAVRRQQVAQTRARPQQPSNAPRPATATASPQPAAATGTGSPPPAARPASTGGPRVVWRREVLWIAENSS